MLSLIILLLLFFQDVLFSCMQSMSTGNLGLGILWSSGEKFSAMNRRLRMKGTSRHQSQMGNIQEMRPEQELEYSKTSSNQGIQPGAKLAAKRT